MNALPRSLTALVLEAAGLSDGERREMFALFERYYDAASWERFRDDLAGKSHVVVLRDDAGGLQGFSTLVAYERVFAGAPVRVLFSGDTVVDERHWGQQALAFAWLRHAGEIHARDSRVPLYWLLISKGHRTYRYLSTFAREYDPAPGRVTPPGIRGLMDFLARDRFGGAYDGQAGVLRFPRSLGHLRECYANVPAAHARLPEVEFFLRRNAGYARGDELVCLARLSPENLRPMARRAFLAGLRATGGA
jgi:hypothetical protein